eukprot:scaffold268_cov210-Ochromonas_danica.AAC.54
MSKEHADNLTSMSCSLTDEDNANAIDLLLCNGFAPEPLLEELRKWKNDSIASSATERGRC